MKVIKWILLLCVLILLPWIIWVVSDEKKLQIAVVNKTVPEGDLSEHKGFFWLLNNMKINDKNSKSYHPEKDYFGLTYKDGSYYDKKLPTDLSNFDLIYIADTYGVDSKDVSNGLSDDEWASIQSANENNSTTLLMEFNSISSPTNDRVREKATKYLGVNQTGWSAKFNLSLAKEDGQVPTWFIEAYEKNDKWSLEGEGIIFHNELTGQVEVLSVNEGTLEEQGLQFQTTNKGEELFSLSKKHIYNNWFDIVLAEDNTDVLAEFNIYATKEGVKKLDTIGISENIPAVIVKKQTKASSYYFAGSFSNVEKTPKVYQYKGFSKMREWLTVEYLFPGDSLYWQIYVPMIKGILKNIESNTGEVESVDTSISTLKTASGLTYNTRIKENRFEVYRNEQWETITIKGVNLGMGKPGVFPGEAAITREEYARWFEYIGEMNANTIRVYTLHPPAFYNALKHYNETHDKPIYVFHGVWIDEAPLEETLDAYTPEITDAFRKEYKQLVDVIHGNAEVPAKVGHAHGTYDSDISPYVIGWMIGIEWYPSMVDNMKTTYSNLDQYSGTYIETKKAEGFEIWLAEQMDVLMEYEADTYKWNRPMSFTNWISTDNIKQPAEPLEQEDIASVNPNHILIKEGLDLPGMFASYHVYPYYPDFLNLDEKYTQYIDYRGKKNNYAGYLHDLKANHEMPVLISEFGIPASRGIAHLNPFGWNQGGHSETEQGEILASLYEDILAEGMMGGIVFSWQEEWFKRTWNTTDLDDPDRRPFWSNVQTNEQKFGLLSFDTLKVQLDGQTEDWQGIQPIYQSSEGPIRSMYVSHDEAYLYIRLDKKPNLYEDWFKDNEVNLLFDVSPKSGSRTINAISSIQVDKPSIDFWANIKSATSGNLLVDAYYDAFLYQYGHILKLLPGNELIPQSSNGVFNPIRYALNKGQVRPDTGEVIPFDAYDTGNLLFGNSNIEAKEYNSLADYYADAKTGVFEMRIPWLLLNVKDPSSKVVLPDLYKEGMEPNLEIEDIGIALVIQKGGQIYSFPEMKNKMIPQANIASYNWEKWKVPPSEERLKESYYILQKKFEMIK